MNTDPITKTYYIVHIGNADLYFETLEQASDFFAKIARAPIKNINYSYEGGKRVEYFQEGQIGISLQQETLTVFPSLEAAKFEVRDHNEL